MKKSLRLLFTVGFILFLSVYAFAGSYSINGAYQGNYSTISIDLNGAINIMTQITPPPSGNTITGRCTLVDNYFGAGKTIGIAGVTMTLSGSGSGTKTTDTNGYYTFASLVDGSYTVTPSSGSYAFAPTSGNANPASNQTITVNFVATPVGNLYSIAGNVKDKNGANLSGVTMQLQWGSTVLDDPPNHPAVLTGADGNYVIGGLPDGLTYTITPIMTGKSFTPTSRNVLVNGSNSTGNNFVEQSGPSGSLGSITNPIKLNKPMGVVYKGYMSQNSPDNTYGTINLPANTKLYFEVDTLETTGISASAFGINTKFYNMAFSVCKSVQNKRTGAYSTEICGYPSAYRDIVYDNDPYDLDNYKYLYGIDNSGGATIFSIDVWVTIIP
jgi:hypothetical protein